MFSKKQTVITQPIALIYPAVLPLAKHAKKTERNMHEAVQMHIQGMIEEKFPIPKSVALAEYIAVTV